MRVIERKCLVCDKKLKIVVGENGKYSGGYYFGEVGFPIEGTGELKKTGKKFMGGNVVKWTGKEDNVEYWECDKCFNED